MEHEFRMNVRKLFRFQGGSLVLAGIVTQGPKYIAGGADYDLFVDGAMLGRVKLVGERFSSGIASDGMRSVEGYFSANVAPEQIEGHEALFRRAA